MHVGPFGYRKPRAIITCWQLKMDNFGEVVGTNGVYKKKYGAVGPQGTLLPKIHY